jgi:hypothetical protein
MPCDYSLRFHDEQGGRPAWPDSPKDGPEEPVKPPHTRAIPFAFQYSNLLAQRKNFERSVRASAEESPQGGHDCEEQIEHTDVVSPEPGYYEDANC